jgi:hypothetical protein
MENLRWPPGGHIGSRIATKIDRAPPQTNTLIPPKYEIKWVRGSQVMKRNVNECKIQDGHLAAILDNGSRPKSIGHLP